nr:hypothetical protein [Treponema sp.]
EEGYLAACTSKENPSAIIMKKIDVYGKTVKNNGQDANVGISSYKFSEEGPNYLVDSVSCIDFVETEDGSCVVLASLSLRKEGADKNSDNPDDFAENNFLFTYNFDTASVVKEKTFNIDKYTPYNLSFNSLTEAEEGVFLASGFAYNFEEGEEPGQEIILFHDLLFRFDSNSGNVKLYIPEDDFTDYTESVLERKISSVFYNAKDNSYYATEIFDFDSSYKSSVVYKSRLLKFDTSLNLQEVLLEKENMLFSSITGSSSTGEYYIAGENYASGVQKGLMISFSNIENGKLLNEPYLYKYDLKSYAWFDSVCICGSNIVVSGSASSKRNEGELPIVVAYNKKGELQWANTNYSDYTEAKSCFSTSIGTYLIHLTGKSNAGNYSTIVSADLLGADTGNKGILE